MTPPSILRATLLASLPAVSALKRRKRSSSGMVLVNLWVYWLKSVVQKQLDAGHDLILEIDVQGCLQAMAQDPTVTGIFVCPPSRENLERRLRGRGTETEESIRVRLNNVAGEVATAYKYHYVIIHQDWADVPNALEIAAEEAYAVILAKRLELENRKGFLDQLSASLKA